MREIAIADICNDSAVQAIITRPITYVNQDQVIRGLAYDSREINPGFLFFALSGLHVDGHQYIDQAIDAGAVAVVHSEAISPRAGVTYIQVADTRKAMAPFASAFWGHPERELTLIGITGTDGKSTTSSFVYQLLQSLGHRAGLITTVEIDLGEGIIINPLHQSTPEAPELYGMLRTMVSHGISYGVIETTSHGLSTEYHRLGGLRFQCGIFTNISHEHLEFHKTMEHYLQSKLNLFRSLTPEGWAIWGGNFPYQKELKEALGNHKSWKVVSTKTTTPNEKFSDEQRNSIPELLPEERCTIMQVTEALVRERGYNLSLKSIPATSTNKANNHTPEEQQDIESYKAQLFLLGDFNIENGLMAALGVATLTNTPIQSALRLLPSLRTPKGRMNIIDQGQPFQAIVDFAHTPGSFARLLPLMKSITKGRLIVLFGSAGERDKGKRKLLGEEANRWADVVVLTNEDPRGEKPMDIIDEIALPLKEPKVYKIPDREDAIIKVCSLAHADDTCLFLGKGHENSIIYKHKEIVWDEEAVLRRAIETIRRESL